jgi:hypothetical protein
MKKAILILSWLFRCFLQSRNNHRGVDGFADFTNIQAAINAAKDGDVELTVVGRFISGRYFHNADTITIISPRDDDG